MPSGFIEPTLVAQAQTGDREAQARLLEQSHDHIIRATIHKKLGNVEEDTVNDLIQGVNLKVLKHLETLKNPYSLKDPYAFPKWVEQITVRACLDYRRARKTHSVEVVYAPEELSVLQEKRGGAVSDEDTAILTREVLEKLRTRMTAADWQLVEDVASGETPEEMLYKRGGKKSKFYAELKRAEFAFLLQAGIREREEYAYDDAEEKLAFLLATRQLQQRSLRKPLKELKAQTLTELAHLRMNRGQVDGAAGALTLFQHASALWGELKAHSHKMSVVHMIGACLYIAGRFTAALDHYRVIDSMVPTDRQGVQKERGVLLKNLGNLERELGHYDLAEHCLEQSLRFHENQGIEEDYREVQLVFARNLIVQGRYEQAARCLEEAKNGVPLYNVLYHLRLKKGWCELYLAAGDRGAGAALAQQGLQLCRAYRFSHQAGQFRHLLQQTTTGGCSSS